jgi:hypothetical protein
MFMNSSSKIVSDPSVQDLISPISYHVNIVSLQNESFISKLFNNRLMLIVLGKAIKVCLFVILSLYCEGSYPFNHND